MPNVRKFKAGAISNSCKVRAVIMGDGSYCKIDPLESDRWRVTVSGISYEFDSRRDAQEFLQELR